MYIYTLTHNIQLHRHSTTPCRYSYHFIDLNKHFNIYIVLLLLFNISKNLHLITCLNRLYKSNRRVS